VSCKQIYRGPLSTARTSAQIRKPIRISLTRSITYRKPSESCMASRTTWIMIGRLQRKAVYHRSRRIRTISLIWLFAPFAWRILFPEATSICRMQLSIALRRKMESSWHGPLPNLRPPEEAEAVANGVRHRPRLHGEERRQSVWKLETGITKPSGPTLLLLNQLAASHPGSRSRRRVRLHHSP
jgi:hypothetical protein